MATTATAKHTAGPWDFVEGDRERAAMSDVFKAGDKDFRIAFVNCEYRNNKQRAEDIANARLIAAAPELLEALQEVVALSDRKHKAWDKAKAAIVKATP